jgi:hypothetical protein
MTTEELKKPPRPTVLVDPEDGGVMAGVWTEPVPGFKRTRVVDRLEEPIDEEEEPCVLDGRPCLLFGMWDYAEDWSGEYVRELHPFLLLRAPKVSVVEF